MEDPVGRWLILAVLTVLCALLSAGRAALENANEGKLHEKENENARVKKLLALLDDPKEALLAVRCTRMFLFFLMGVICAGMTAGIWQKALCCLAGAFVCSVLCILVSEKIGRRKADSTALALYPLMRFVEMLGVPFAFLAKCAAHGIVRLFGIDPHAPEEEVTQEEIQDMLDIGEESGVIESDEHEMIKNVFDFGDLTAADCMTHRTNVTAISLEDSEQEILATIRESGLSRFPVYREDIDDVVGILATREYLLNMEAENPKPLSALLRKPYFVPETVPSDVLLRNMQRAKTHLAIVVDEYGGMSGIITMEDLLEEIVGNIYDEFDPTAETEIEKLSEKVWRVSGTADLETLAEEMGVDLPQDEDYDTLGGLIYSRFDTIPADGTTPEITICCTSDGEEPEEGDCDRILVQVQKIEDRRVAWAKVTLLPKKDDGTEKDKDKKEHE